MKQRTLGRIAAVPLSASLLLAACGQSEPEETKEAQPTESTPDTTGAPAAHGSVIDVDPDAPTPSVAITIEEDAKSGQNLFVELENFTITPEDASTDPVEGQGHLHLYIDGERSKRFYNEELHLNLDEGTHEVEVEISANNHSAYAIDGEAIRAAATIDVGESPTSHDHDDSALVDISDLPDAPAIELSVTKDPKSGWNLQAPVQNFELSAPATSGDTKDGHLHLAIDGEMSERLYGEWTHIPELDEGDHEISVMLVGNDHKALALGELPLAASETVSVTAEEAAGSDHGDHHGDEMKKDDEMEDHDNGHGHGESQGSSSIEDGLKESDATTMIDFEVAAGEVTTTVDGDAITGSVKIEADSVVAIRTSSDVEDMVHLHLHDILVDVSPDSDGTIVFTADTPGTLEVELEESGTLLANLEIS